MGSCFGDEQDKSVQHEQNEAQNIHKTIKQILFLGSGGSGKTTIFKQLRGIYGQGYTENERSQFIIHIHEQCISQMIMALEALNEFDPKSDDHEIFQDNLQLYHISSSDIKDDEDEDLLTDIPELSDSGRQAAHYIQNGSYARTRLADEAIAALKILWAEPAIKRMYALRNVTKIEDSSAYFWGKLDELHGTRYTPDHTDILLVRHRTTGINEQTYEFGQNKGTFKIIDVGGQKSERKKWFSCFDKVTAVIFVASLSCYDEVMWESMEMNSMTDQLHLFDDIINQHALRQTSMILFLNKRDLFAKKIDAGVPITLCNSFTSYDGPPDSFDQNTKYIRKAFTSLNQEPLKRNIFTHITVATDDDNIQKVFADVQHIVIEASLIKAGLMDFDTAELDKKPGDDDQRDDALAVKVREAFQRQQSAQVRSVSRGVSRNIPRGFRDAITSGLVPDKSAITEVLTAYTYDDDANNLLFGSGDGDGDEIADALHCSTCWARSDGAMYLMLDVAPRKAERGNAVAPAMRAQLNLCVVLDVGASMNHRFSDETNRMAQTKRTIISLIREQLRDHDRFGLIWFDDVTKVFQALTPVGELDVDDLVHKIETQINCSHTTMNSQRVDTAAFTMGVDQFRKLFTAQQRGGGGKASSSDVNRIVMISALPLNEKTVSECESVSSHEETSKRVFASFVCLQNDAQPGWDRIVAQRERVYALRGCNYLTINSSEQLTQKLLRHFHELVAVQLLDLCVMLEAADNNENCIASVARCNADQSKNRLFGRQKQRERALSQKNQVLEVGTVFVRESEQDVEDFNYRNLRHLLLVRLVAQSNYEYQLVLQASRAGNEQAESPKTIQLHSAADKDADYFDNRAIRKAVLLSRYEALLREWIEDGGQGLKQRSTSLKPGSKKQSMVHVSGDWQNKFKVFAQHFQRQMLECQDEALEKELEVLNHLAR